MRAVFEWGIQQTTIKVEGHNRQTPNRTEPENGEGTSTSNEEQPTTQKHQTVPMDTQELNFPSEVHDASNPNLNMNTHTTTETNPSEDNSRILREERNALFKQELE